MTAPGGGALNAPTAKAVNFAASKGVLVLSAAANYGLDLGQLFDYVVVPVAPRDHPPYYFCSAWGTSMSTLHAAGVAALIVDQNPGISLGALKARRLNTADDEGKVGHDEYCGHGFLNARHAVGQ